MNTGFAGKMILILVVTLMLLVTLVGCTVFKEADSGEKSTYDVCDESMIPPELLDIINRKKVKAFNMVYSNNTYTYIVMAAGEQKRDDVGVVVEEMYRDKNAIYIKGILKQVATPTDAADISGDHVSYPYVVIRITKTDIPIVFKD